MNALKPDADQGIYHVGSPGEVHPVTFAVRVGERTPDVHPAPEDDRVRDRAERLDSERRGARRGPPIRIGAP